MSLSKDLLNTCFQAALEKASQTVNGNDHSNELTEYQEDLSKVRAESYFFYHGMDGAGGRSLSATSLRAGVGTEGAASDFYACRDLVKAAIKRAKAAGMSDSACTKRQAKSLSKQGQQDQSELA